MKGGSRDERLFRFQLIDDRVFTPLLASWCVEEAVLFAQNLRGEAMISTRLELELEGKETIALENEFYAQKI